MKTMMFAIVMLISSECIMARAKWTTELQALWQKTRLTGEAERGRAKLLQTAALAVALLTAPLGGFANDGSDARQSPPARSEASSQHHHEMISDLKGWSYTRASMGWGLSKDSVAQNFSIARGSREFAGRAGTMRVLNRIRVGGGDSFFFASNGIFGFNALDFAQEKVTPLVYLEYRSDAFNDVSVNTAGIGFEFLDDLLISGNNTSVQLHAGLGKLSSLVYTSSANEQDRLIDNDAVIALKLVGVTTGITFGDMLNKKHDSYWHWVSIFPRVKIVMALHKPIFDRGGEYSGNMMHSLRAQLSFVDSLHLIFEHVNSPNFQEPYQMIGVRFDFFETINNYYDIP